MNAQIPNTMNIPKLPMRVVVQDCTDSVFIENANGKHVFLIGQVEYDSKFFEAFGRRITISNTKVRYFDAKETADLIVSLVNNYAKATGKTK